MAEITPDNEMIIFKNEVYSHIRELETQLNTRLNKTQIKLDSDFDSYSKKIDTLIENNKEMILSLVSQKIKVEKISELESFKNKVDDMIITHEVRIKNNMDEISKIKLKYDKIIVDNLYVSGFIGTACQFKNLSEYLSYNISEVSKLKLEKEQLKKDLKEIKGKFDGLMKTIINLNDNSVKLCNKYTDNKQVEIQNIVDNNTKELNQRSVENRALICEFQNKNEKTEKKYKEELDKVIEMKKDFLNIIDEKMIEIKKYNEELNKKIINNNLDIDINKKKIENINEQIKDLIQNNKDISFQVRNYYCANNKLANFIEKLGNIPTNSDISKLFQIKNEINLTNNNYSISPMKKKGIKQNMTKTALNIKPFKDTMNNSPIKKTRKIFNRIGITAKNETSESESSISDNNNHNKFNKSTINIENKENKVIINKKRNSLVIDNLKNKNILNFNIKINENKKNLPSLTRNYNEKNNALEDNKKNNLTSNETNKSIVIKEKKNLSERNEQKINIKKETILKIINKNETDKDKLKINQKKELFHKKDEYQLEQDKQACKLVTLTLPNSLKENLVTKKNKIQKDKLKTDVMNTLINSYRAKLFYKAHSPDEKNEFNNELLDIPKKITQAFGRTTYTFYFKKDQINNLNANKNINNFQIPNSKRNYKDIKTIIRNDTG